METNFPIWVDASAKEIYLTPHTKCKCFVYESSELAATVIRYLRSTGYTITDQDAATLEELKEQSSVL